ncbi:MAG: VPA1269 family protein [Thalassotalea sp.]|nr:VPA1269 family protein [Thalassotalea sp.]
MSNNILNYQEFVSVMNANNVNQYGFSTFKNRWNNQQSKKHIPEKPSSHYEEWVSWHVVVSCGNGTNIMSYGDFCKLMLDNNITANTYDKFRTRSPEKERLPRSPSSAYAEWNSWDNLDPDADYKMKLDFIGFCQFIYKKCSTRSQYKNFRQAYDGVYFLPGKPENYYKEWCGWENIREDMTRRFANFDEFKSVVISNLVPKHLWGEMYKSFDNEKYYLHSKPWEFYEEYSKWPISSTRRRLSYKTAVFLMYETGLSWEALYKSKNFDMTKEAPPYYGDIWEGHECIKHGNSILLCLGYEAFCKVIQENKVKEDNYREFTFQYNLNTEAGNLLPLDPKKCYGELWLGWDEVLGNKKKRAYPPFTQFLKIANKNEFLRANYISKAKRIKTKYLLPDNPLEIYDECSNWFDITGVPEVVEYEEFTKFVLENEITLTQWLTGAKLRQEYAEQNPGKILPGNPQEFYAEYTSWKHIYDSGLSPQRAPDGREYMHFDKFEEFIKENKVIASRGGEYTKLRKDKDSEYALPYDPYAHYGEQLKTWPYTQNGKSRIKGMQPISELKKLCRSINCKSVHQFDQYRAEHPELLLVHSDSWRKMDGFISTDDVLGKSYKYVSDVLDSLKKIIKFQSLDITISDVTEGLYKELTEFDDALVPEPLDYYSLDEWDDLLTFKFYTLEDIKNFCKINSISTNTEYIRHMQKNPYMRPLNYYAKQCFDYSKGILAEREYFKSSCDPNYEEWTIYATDWIKSQKSQASRRIIIKNFINGVLSKNKLETRPGVYFHVDSEHGTLQEIFDSVIESRKNIVVSTVNSYLDYCLENSCGDRDPETKELVILEGFANPFSEMDDDNQISIAKKNETVKPILPYSDIVNAQNHLLQPEAESFSGLANAQSIYSSDWYYVDKEDIDFNDPDCVWRESPAISPKKPYQMWFPGSAVAMAALLYTPHRGRQIVFCDSGEADISKLVVNKESGLPIYEWQENNNVLACAKYNGKKRTSQGMLLKLSDTLSLDEQIHRQKILWQKKHSSLDSFVLDADSLESNASSVGCYTTTNKTATFSKGGHSVPYIPEALIKWLIKLRDWQSKYNPIEKLVSWKEVPNTGLTDKAFKQLDHQSFLFRNASGKNKFERCLPITTGKAFNALALLLSRIQTQEFPLTTRNPGSDVNTYNGWSSKYTPHCLRASLITAYILDGGIAPHIVQKMVGHHSIIMTLYYTKVGLGDVRQHFSEAEEKMLHKAPERIKN